MKVPTLSICIPAYKRPNDLKKCLESLVSQEIFKEKWLDVIICDDAPDLPITSIVTPFQKKFGETKFKYFLNKKNLGFEKNILLCIEKSESEFIFFLTDDDVFTPNSLEKLQNILLTKPEIDFFTSSYLTQSEDGNVYGNYKIYSHSKRLSKNPQDQALFYSICNDLSGKCFRKKYFSVDGYSKHFGSMYPHLYALGKLLLTRPTYYESTALFTQTIGNHTYWNYPPDHCIKSLFKIIDDLSIFSPKFDHFAKKHIIKNFPYIIYMYLKSPKRLVLFLYYLVIYNILFVPINWIYFGEGITSLIKQKYFKQTAVTV